MRHILVSTNNFWVGGRETYNATYLKNLRQRGLKFSLIASSIFHDTPEASVFNEKIECGTGDYVTRWRNWLQAASELFAVNRPALIWAHHFDLFPAWLISRLYEIPLLTTFHGPLIAAGRPNDPMQALGMVLAVHRGDGVSAVSEEIAAGIGRLNQGAKRVSVIPNAIEIEEAARRQSGEAGPRRFVLITRPEKLGHMRQATLLFSEYLKRGGRGRLTIAAGRSPDDARRARARGVPKSFSKAKSAMQHLGGKWCYEQGISLLRALRHVDFHGYTSDARELIREADVVLGMGRVLLEGMAEGKPCVLIGYDEICGLVTPETFEQYRWSNFSGRGIEPQPAAAVCESLRGFGRHGSAQSAGHLSAIDVATCGDRLGGLLEELIGSAVFAEDEVKLARELSESISSTEFRSEDIYSSVCSRLSPRELSSLYLLSIG
jgi:glycosyltransferase involved in cell wall biosynthesis